MSVPDLLARIEAALDTADFAEMGRCAPLLEQAVATLRGADVDLADLRARAVRVSHRLQNAAEGVRAARWRLADIRAMGASGDRLVTYDGQGQRHDTGAGGLLTRRF